MMRIKADILEARPMTMWLGQSEKVDLVRDGTIVAHTGNPSITEVKFILESFMMVDGKSAVPKSTPDPGCSQCLHFESEQFLCTGPFESRCYYNYGIIIDHDAISGFYKSVGARIIDC